MFSFKLRGAYNKMSMLDKPSRAKGVIAASAGNHVQGVALAAKRLSIKALIVMPATTPEIKIKFVKAMGAEPFRLAESYVDEVITVNTDEICAAIKDIFDDARSIAEPAGALATAGLKKYVERVF